MVTPWPVSYTHLDVYKRQPRYLFQMVPSLALAALLARKPLSIPIVFRFSIFMRKLGFLEGIGKGGGKGKVFHILRRPG